MPGPCCPRTAVIIRQTTQSGDWHSRRVGWSPGRGGQSGAGGVAVALAVGQDPGLLAAVHLPGMAVTGEVDDVAWSYPEPPPESRPIKGFLSFDSARVDMLAELPATGRS